MRHDFHQRAVVEAGGASGGKLRIAHLAALGDHRAGEGQGAFRLAVRRASGAGEGDIGVGEAGALADQGVGGKAIVAAIHLGDGDGEALARLRRQGTAAQRAGQADEAFQGGGSIGGDLEQVGRGAELRLDGGEQLLGLAGSGGGIEGRDAAGVVHGSAFRVSLGVGPAFDRGPVTNS